MPTAPDLVRAQAARLPPVRRLAEIAAGVLVLLFLVGGLASWRGDGSALLMAFHLDRELNVPAILSAAVLLACAVLAGVEGAATGEGAHWWVLGTLFLFMSGDELAGTHEALERMAGIDWQVLYTPLVVTGAVAFVVVLRRLPSPLAGWWAAGAVCWVVSQGFEFAQWDGDELVYPWMILPEEMLEITGSTIWALTLLSLVRRRA